jgi:hypothetical protein
MQLQRQKKNLLSVAIKANCQATIWFDSLNKFRQTAIANLQKWPACTMYSVIQGIGRQVKK